VQERHEVMGGFLETRKDTAIGFDFIEKAVDEIALLIGMSVVVPGHRAMHALLVIGSIADGILKPHTMNGERSRASNAS